ncbi:hypothetical protein B0H13DRAFT_2305995 [Mycena leptocephala]|nr:hypothetical protein B0H13DRAFT_2305995 [Mycena leptocephala]
MASLDTPYLNETEEDAIRALHKSVRATRYEDPVDQDAFLVAAARSVLQFREQVASFALTADIAECVFAIRSQLHSNNSRLGTPPDEAFSTISDFAGEIARTRQLYRDRKRAQTARISAEEGVAARAERREALKHAAKFQKHPRSPDEDAVSIPSDTEDEPCLFAVQLALFSYANAEATGVAPMTPVCPVALLSPIPELESLMFSFRLSDPPFTGPISPSTPLSLPDLVPIASPASSGPTVNVRDWRKTMSVPPSFRPRIITRNPPNTRVPTPMPTLRFNVANPVLPHRVKPVPRRPNLNYADDSLVLKPKFAASHARKNTLLGRSKYYKMLPPTNRKPKTPTLQGVFQPFLYNWQFIILIACPLATVLLIVNFALILFIAELLVRKHPILDVLYLTNHAFFTSRSIKLLVKIPHIHCNTFHP